jgi:hypothetical protein
MQTLSPNEKAMLALSVYLIPNFFTNDGFVRELEKRRNEINIF